MDTIEGPRAPAVKLTARHSSLTRVRAAPLSPLTAFSIGPTVINIHFLLVTFDSESPWHGFNTPSHPGTLVSSLRQTNTLPFRVPISPPLYTAPYSQCALYPPLPPSFACPMHAMIVLVPACMF